MYKVIFKIEEFWAVDFFKIFKTKEDADAFIKELGDRFMSVKLI